MKIAERKTCRISGGPLVDVFGLVLLPFTYFPSAQEESPPSLPLKLALNVESGLVQLRHTIDPDQMYSQYWYMSGINQSMISALRSIVGQAIARRGKALKRGDIV